MALDFKSFFNKIRIKNASTSSKQLDLVVSDSSTENTTTTIIANQTANRTLTLPDSSGTVVATTVTLDNLAVVTTDASGQITTDSGISKSELQSLEGITGLVQIRLNSAESNISSIDGRVTTVEGNRALTTLSNLGTTSINQDLLPDTTYTKDLGGTSNRWNNLYSYTAQITKQVVLGGEQYLIQKNGYTPSANLTNTVESYDIDLGLFTSNDSGGASVATKNVRIETGNKTSGTGNSGDIKLQTGTSFGGSRGKVILDGLNIDMSARVVKNAADPVDVQDLATKNYVDLNSGTGGGANKTLSNLEPTSINQPLIPQVDSSLALGSTNFRWAQVSCTSVNSTNNGVFNRSNVGGGFDIQDVPFSAHGMVIGPDRIGVVKTQDNLVGNNVYTKDLYITTGDNAGTGGGSGKVYVRSGAATNGIPGAVYIESSPNTGSTGSIYLRTGNSTGAAAGSINIYAGDGASSGGGQVIISAGKNGPTQIGGKISIVDGNSSSITSGHIILEAGKGTNISGSIYLTPGTNGSGAKGTIFVGGPLGLDAQPSDPLANLQIGQIYFNTTSNTIKVYTSTGWKTLTPT